MTVAVVRDVSPALVNCELSYVPRTPIDVELARAQHRNYCAALAELGCTLVALPMEPELPDAVFVEDAALVFDELAVITRPGAVSRRPELPSVVQALERYRRLETLEEPATLDGGDVLRVGRMVFVGLSGRTNAAAVERLTALLQPFGYAVRAVPVQRCLHLKSAVGRVAPDTILINRDWVDAERFSGLRLIDVDPREPHGANALPVSDGVVYPASCPRTQRRLEEWGIAVRPVDVSELEKAEGAVTCCSLILEVDGPAR